MDEFKFYLRIYKENSSFGFVIEDLFSKPLDTDILITEEEYNKFFKLQSQGKQFKLKDTITGVGLFDYVEEYIPEPMKVGKTETDELKQQILDLQEIISDMQYEKLAGGV